MSTSLREKEFINVKELADILNVSKTYAYELLNSSDCPFNAIRLGKKRILIPTITLPIHIPGRNAGLFCVLFP